VFLKHGEEHPKVQESKKWGVKCCEVQCSKVKWWSGVKCTVI